MNYQIAIASYKRPTTIQHQTLAMLARLRVDPAFVTIFVASDSERQIYEAALQDNPYGRNIAVAVPGMSAVRNFIRSYYADGQFIISIDDDVDKVIKIVPAGEKRTQTEISTIDEIAVPMHDAMTQFGTKLCGLSPTNHRYFMDFDVKVGLYFCVGSLWGCINSHDPRRYVKTAEKEDYERTIQHFIIDGAVTRLDWLSVYTRYYEEPGGLQEVRTPETTRASAEYIVSSYPDFARLYTRKSSGFAELRLRDPNRVRRGPEE